MEAWHGKARVCKRCWPFRKLVSVSKQRLTTLHGLSGRTEDSLLPRDNIVPLRKGLTNGLKMAPALHPHGVGKATHNGKACTHCLLLLRVFGSSLSNGPFLLVESSLCGHRPSVSTADREAKLHGFPESPGTHNFFHQHLRVPGTRFRLQSSILLKLCSCMPIFDCMQACG